MQQLPLEMPLLLERVQVTHRSLRQAHERLGASLVLFEHVLAVRSKYCKQATKTVRDMGGLAASLHAFLLTQDYPASLTVGLRLSLGLLMQYTNKAAMQLVLVQSCCRRHTALVSWLHQQACAYLDTVMHINRETLRELARLATQVCLAASDHQQESVVGRDGSIDLLLPESGQA
ncbi:MAG TPA: hypothetical protein VKB35_11725 [Ktedonobacteraceae bacterium]|nr:hypothetical protein [Ktedonobacteraceae bacterium]